MIELRRQKGKGRERTFTTHPVYTYTEAQMLGIEAIPWREARNAGEWAISDDGYVSEVLGVRGPYGESKGSKREKVFITLPYARRFVSGALLNFEECYTRYLDGGTLSASDGKSSYARMLKNARGQRTIKAYVALLIERGGDCNFTEEDWEALQSLYVWHKQHVPAKLLRRFIRSKEAQEMIAEEVFQLLAGKGITQEKVIDRYEEVYTRALTHKQLGVAKSVIDKYAQLLDLQVSKVNKEAVEFSFAQVLEQAESAGLLVEAKVKDHEL